MDVLALRSREVLVCYLYGIYPFVNTDGDKHFACAESVENLIGKAEFPAGLFCKR